MPRRMTHTDKWWDNAPSHILRCSAHYKSTGEQCRSEAAPGTSVCDKHGALVPAVQAAAANRIQMSVDEAAKHMVEWLSDPNVDMRERIKVATDLLDRGGLAATSKHLVGVVGSSDPVERLFLDILADPNGLVDPTPVPVQPDPEQLALEQRAEPDFDDLIGDVVDAELVEDVPAPAPELNPAQVEKPKRVKGIRNPAKPPKHIRDDLERLGLL